eukprot:scaffold39512_cov63-Phaeocystis_antarctica.AAC.3
MPQPGTALPSVYTPSARPKRPRSSAAGAKTSRIQVKRMARCRTASRAWLEGEGDHARLAAVAAVVGPAVIGHHPRLE